MNNPARPRVPGIAVAALVALHATFALLALIPAPHPGGDNGVYLALGHALLDGGYRDLFDPALPRHTQFPPGYPAIIAAALAAGIDSWVGLKLIIIAFSAAAVALTFRWIAAEAGPRAALGVAFLTAVSPGVLALTRWELSDVPFWALTTGALVLLQRVPRGGPRVTAGAAALAACAYLTRSAGLPLLVAALAWLLWQRRWRQVAVFGAVVAPPVLAWSIWTRAHGGYASLIMSANPYDPAASTIGIGGVPGRVLENAVLYASTYLPTLIAGREGGIITGAAVLLLLAAAAGWALKARTARVVELWLPLYTGMLLLWNPEWSGERLLLPVYPALLYYAGIAIVALAQGGRAPSNVAAHADAARSRGRVHEAQRTEPPGTRGPSAAAAGALVLLLIAVPGVVAAARLGTFCSRQYLRGDALACLDTSWRDFFEIAGHARNALPDGAAVLVRKPALFWTAAGIPGRMYPLSAEPGAFFSAAREAGADYVVLDALDQLSERYLMPILIARSAAFCIVHSLGPDRTTLLGILPGAALVPDAGTDAAGAEVTIAFRPCGPEFRRSTASPAPVTS